MKRYSMFAKVALLLAVVSLLGGLQPVAAAESSATTPGYEADPGLQRHHRMSELMNQMQAQVGVMSKRMADPKLTAKQRKAMAEDMKRMASMMHRMSGLADRPSMKEPEARKQLDAMANGMAAMQKRHEQYGPAATK